MARIHEAFDRSINMRGTILHCMIEVERMVDEFLSLYFTSDENKGNELKEMLWYTERINLGSKKDILFLIVDRHRKDWINKNPGFKASLDNIVPHRNIFAHLEIDLIKEFTATEGDPVELIFKKYTGGKLKSITYTNDVLVNLMTDFKNLKNQLLELIETNKAPSD